MMLLNGSANRDDRKCVDGDRFDVSRKSERWEHAVQAHTSTVRGWRRLPVITPRTPNYRP
jgi:cytochrome P450